MRLGNQSHRHAPAEAAAESLMANTAPTPKAVALVLIPALVLMLAFAFSYVGAFHEPTPHDVPVAVVGLPAAAVQLSPPARRSARGAARRPAPMRCRRSTIARFTAPTSQPRTACSSRRPPTGRPPSRWKRRSTASPLRRADRPSASPTSSRCLPRTPMGPRRLRGDRVDVRRLHRRNAHRVDREPTQRQQAARCSADRSARSRCARSRR
jgi:hypothetical protein